MTPKEDPKKEEPDFFRSKCFENYFLRVSHILSEALGSILGKYDLASILWHFWPADAPPVTKSLIKSLSEHSLISESTIYRARQHLIVGIVQQGPQQNLLAEIPPVAREQPVPEAELIRIRNHIRRLNYQERVRYNVRRRVGRLPRRSLDEIEQSLNPDDREAHLLIRFLRDEAPVKSGTTNIRTLRFGTWNGAYHGYLTWMAINGQNGPVMNIHTFTRTCKRWHIGRLRFDRYVCPICYYQPNDNIEQLNQNYLEHRRIVGLMQEEYRNQLAQLQNSNAVLLIVDYCRFHEVNGKSVATHLTYKRDSTKNKKSNMKTSLLGFTVVSTKDPQCESEKDFHIDLFGQVKQGPSFFKAGIMHLMTYLKSMPKQIDNIHIWGDGGLKTYGSISGFALLQSEFPHARVSVHFFASYHGHGRCDAHFGIGKMISRRKHQGMLDPETMRQVFQQIPRTQTFLLDSRTPPDMTQYKYWSPGISSYHSFQIASYGEDIRVSCWETVPIIEDAIQQPTLQQLCTINTISTTVAQKTGLSPEKQTRTNQEDDLSEMEEEMIDEECLLDQNVCDDQDQLDDRDYDENHIFHDIDDVDPDCLGFLNFSAIKNTNSRPSFQLEDIWATIPQISNSKHLRNYLDTYLKNDTDKKRLIAGFQVWKKGSSSSEEFQNLMRQIINSSSVK